ncbi:MAG: hypothetical protein ACYTFQ_32940 [Planctomycetota bacterium]
MAVLACGSETLILHSNQGQSATEGAASIQLLSDAGGINIKGNLNNSDAVLLTADGGTSATIRIHNDQGEGTGSIAIVSDAGGVTVDGGSAQDVVVTSTGAAVNLVSTQAALDAIKLNPSDADGGVDVSDSNMANVGDIYCDDLVTDGSSDVMWVLKTVVKTIDVDDDASTDDFQFDDDAGNQTEQPVDLGAILPAYAEIVSAQIRCFETVTGSAQMAIDLGTASGGAEILASANTDTANDINGTGAGDGPEILAANTAKNVWINATPGVNWDTLDAGRWAVMVTYIDYGAVYTQKNP